MCFWASGIGPLAFSIINTLINNQISPYTHLRMMVLLHKWETQEEGTDLGEMERSYAPGVMDFR